MKFSRLIGLAVIALLVVGGMGFVSTRSLAKASSAHTQQAQATSIALNNGAPDNEGKPAGPDIDNIQEQVGDQSGQQVEDGLPDTAEVPGKEDTGSATQPSSNTSSIPPQGGSLVAPQGQGKVTLTKTTLQKAQVAPLSTGLNTSNSALTAQTGQQVGDGLPDGSETPGIEDGVQGQDTDNIQEQVGDQSGQQIEDGQPDNNGAPGN